jgi:hypothetical protein
LFEDAWEELPKIQNHPWNDAPDWAICRAVDEDGAGYYFDSTNIEHFSIAPVMWCSDDREGAISQEIEGMKFDTTNWNNRIYCRDGRVLDAKGENIGGFNSKGDFISNSRPQQKAPKEKRRV